MLYYGFIGDVASNEYKIVCPFHEDINPSMLVNLDDGSWFCFGCGETGDAFKFVRMMHPKLTDLQACKVYFEILNSKECVNVDLSKRTKRIKATNQHALDVAADYYYGLRTIDWRRDQEQEVIDAGNYMVNRGFKKSTLTKCKAKVTYNRAYGIIFPMVDNGKFKGWVCRTMKRSVEKKRKYLYNEGFSRANTLVGKYGSKKYVFVVEGYMDHLKFRENGCHNVVAILGWKMSDEQIRKLKEAGVEWVISALDNDECGKKGTKFLEEHFGVTRFKYLKGIKDPGEMTKKDFDKMFKKTIETMMKDRQAVKISESRSRTSSKKKAKDTN